MMEKKHTQISKTKIKEENLHDLAGKIEETDEMKLKMLAALDTPDPDDVFYPPELNAHLIEQLKVMTCENNELRKCVFTKEEEIKELNKIVLNLNQRIRDMISGTGPAISSKSAGIISAKITELCKQNRHLVAEVESHKTKNAALERKIMQLEIINKEKEKIDVCVCKEEPVDVSSDELKELNNKLAAVNKKLYDSKNKNLELKNEILIATKILQQELGDKFTSIKELQSDIAGWKGRAEKILRLQARINELEEKLNCRQKDDPKKKDPSQKMQMQIIKDLEMKRKTEIDDTIKELECIKLENQELKKKLDGAKCRIKNLECDHTNLRQKIQTLIDKSNHDDLLVNEQRNQIKNLERYYQEILKENTTKMMKMQSDLQDYQKLNDNTESKIDALCVQANEKAAKIEELRAQLLRYEECSLQSVFFTPMKTATDNEIQKLSELVVTLNERLDRERHQYEELYTNNRKLKEKKRRLERKIAVLEEELKTFKLSKRPSRASKLSLTKDAIEISCATSLTKKQSSVSGLAEKNTSSSESQSESYDNLEKDELKCKLELADEKLKFLEDKLKMLEEEKQDDFDNLTKMIQNSKQLFSDALAVLQKEKCVCS